MPATEKTLYNQKLLHKIFGISSVVLLLATIWMFAADHNREWKDYQRNARDINVSMSNWLAIQEEASGNSEERQRLSKTLKEAKASPPDQKAVDQFIAEVERFEKQTEKTTGIAANLKALDAAIDGKTDAAAIAARSKLIEELRVVVTAVKFRENSGLTAKKFQAADFDVAKSDVDIAVRDNLAKAEYEARQDNAKIVKAKLDEIVADYQAEAKHRENLEAALKEIERPVTDAQDAIDETTAKHEQLLSALTEQEANWFTTKHFPGLGKKWLELPILDAFGSPLRIDNLWTDGLEHRHYNFSDVTRFDRCTTCHKMLEKSDAVFQKPSEITLTLQSPSSKADTLEATFGMKLASKGLAQPDDVTIQFVTPKSIAAQAITKVASSGEISAEEIRVAVAHGKTPGQVPVSNGLAVGDVITHIAGVEGKLNPALVRKHLMNSSNWPIELTIRRGFANPYQAHPRLDLYLDSASPHKLQTFGCTVCHDGQGSATTFKWASHTPNDEATRKEWTEEHGWFDNHHWIAPMMPERFIQSSCLKCHHEVAELEKSPRFPEPPAEKLTDGYHLIRRYGCFGCHEINGYDGPDQRIGPDLRLEPNYFAAALQLKIDPNLSEDQRDTATRLANDPDDDEARQALFDLLIADEGLEKPTLTPQSHNLAAALKKVEVPGRMRKVGPSLRHVAQKASESFLYDWIAEPKNFRPETRMPQFFGLHKHLQDSAGLGVAEKYEPVEILGIVKYLQNVSQPFEVLQKEISGDATRGKTVFEVGGCIACHQHDSLPGIGGDQGPNLSRIGGKTSKKWLYAWIENPKAYHARSKMPKVFLDPLPTHPDSDPIADVVEFLAAGGSDWTPKSSKLTVDDGTLKDVVLELLEGAFFKADAEDYLANGIPTSMRSSLKGAEVELVSDSGLTTEQKLLYVGRKAIGKYGCSACHDIPGFENSKPIGAALAEWGTKDPSKLAFEHMHEYLHAGHDDHADSKHGEEGHSDEAEGEKHDDHATDAEHGDGHDAAVPPFFERQLNSHSRIGFLYQKLREPRSYDYQKTENKGYNERLRMPQFPFNDVEREKVMTFVLGLTASPPRSKFVFQPDQRAKTLIEGRRVLKKYNCGGCHTLELETWDIAFKPGTFDAQSPSTSFPYLRSDVSAEVLAQSKEQDSAGLLHASIAGMLRVHTEDGLPLAYDEEEDPIEPDEDYDPSTLIYLFDLWRPTAIEGTVFRQGVKTFEIPATAIEKKHPAWGGDLPRWAIGTAIQIEKDVTKERVGKGGTAWSWLPPPLIGEGKKVQTDWLHDFLLDPHPIRPASITRMPKFNMSSDEAEKLVNYFAAVENMDYPYEFKSRTRTSHIAQAEAAYTGKADGPGNVRMGDAMNIVVSLCVQCHHVGDFHPDGNPRGHGPDLSEIYRRMRPGYLRDWIADPKLLLPYTAMPSNIPYKSDDKEHLGGVSQDLYHGTSIDQVEGLVDLLMNFDDYSRKRSRVVPLFLANEVAKKVVERQAAEAAVVAANEVLETATKALDAAEEPADKEAAQAKVTAAEGVLKTAEDALKAADDALKLAEEALKKA